MQKNLLNKLKIIGCIDFNLPHCQKYLTRNHISPVHEDSVYVADGRQHRKSVGAVLQGGVCADTQYTVLMPFRLQPLHLNSGNGRRAGVVLHSFHLMELKIRLPVPMTRSSAFYKPWYPGRKVHIIRINNFFVHQKSEFSFWPFGAFYVTDETAKYVVNMLNEVTDLD